MSCTADESAASPTVPMSRAAAEAAARSAAHAETMWLPDDIAAAAIRGEIKRVGKWLDKGGHLNALTRRGTHQEGMHLLSLAASRGQIKLVAWLLQRGANVDDLSIDSTAPDVTSTPIVFAAGFGHAETVKLLLQHSATVDLGMPPALICAAVCGLEAITRILLRAGADPALVASNFATPATALEVAESGGHLSVARLLREAAAVPAPSVPTSANAPVPLPATIQEAATRGESKRVCKWLRSGHVDTRCLEVDIVPGRSVNDTLLTAAAAHGQIELLRELLRRNASVDLQDSSGVTALMQASQGHIEMVRELLRRGARVDVQDDGGGTALMHAAFKGELAILRLLISHSANVDLQARSGGTALVHAAEARRESCVRELLRAHANAELRNAKSLTALDIADEEDNKSKCPELLRQHMAASAPPTARDGATASDAAPATVEMEGEAASTASAVPPACSPEPEWVPEDVLLAAGTGDMKLVRAWLRTGDVNARTRPESQGGKLWSVSLLATAAVGGQIEAARELLQLGADINGRDAGLNTALMQCALMGRSEGVRFLLQHSASVDLQSTLGHSALMLAAASGSWDCVRALLDAGADPELCDVRGCTAFQIAENKGFAGIAQLLTSPKKLAKEAAEKAKAEAARAAKAEAMMAELLAEEEAAELAHAAQQTSAKSKKAKKKQKKQQAEKHAGQSSGASASVAAAAAAPTTTSAPAPAPPAPSPPSPSPVARAETSLRSAMAQGGLSSLEAALEAAPREAREGIIGVEAAARRDALLEARRGAEEKAKREAAEEARKHVAEERARAEATTKQARAAAAKEAAATKRAADERARAEAAAAAKAAAAADDDVPDEYVCPITAEIMSDPVCLSDGFTYERAAIAQWLEGHDTSPRTGATLEQKALFPVHGLKILIRKFVEETGRA